MTGGGGWKGCWLALALGLAAVGPVAAADLVEPGEVPELGPDEGLVVVAFDSEVSIDHYLVDWAGSAGGRKIFGGPAGQYASLYRVKAGRHAVTRVDRGNAKADFCLDSRVAFDC